MGLKDILNGANRNSGDWLPGVEGCVQRAHPCGNPYCADEAMRSKQVAGSSSHAANQAYQHAHKIAENCSLGCASCPLNTQELGGIVRVLDKLAGR